RCHASRAGLREVAGYVEQLGSSPQATKELLDQIRKLANSDVYWDEVVAVEEFEPEDRWVYDLSVDETHNFVADNVIVHNSNVADAVRWALGENNARVLRAKRNEELIFGGSETRKALSHAEALLQLDNSSRRLPIDFTEIEVGRRLFRNGEAEYLVNRSRVRLRDLQDLLAGANLADNPFVVIGQGLVDQILALRPADRRTVIEEAAGTRRLQLRREEALNRLKHAEVELVRVTDILREIGPRVQMLRERRGRGEREALGAARRAREPADAARAAEEDASRTRVALAEARAARVEAERAHLLRENDEVRISDEERSLHERDEELSRAA